jgi:hypothetical protein
MKYIKQIMWKLLQDKPKLESIMKRLRRSKDRKKSTIKRKLEKDSLRRDILQKTIRMEAWTLLDGGSRLYALIHEARIRRELIL